MASDDGVITVDGGAGEGGGQILRTALSCAAVLRRCVRITSIRAGRPKPGLQRQHLACVEALRGVCPGSVVEGASLGSSQLTFDARGASIAAGDHTYDIGSAGSTTLVLQTVVPALLFAPAPSTMTVGSGTHNPMAPPFDFLRDALAPVLAAAGVRVEFELLRYGFYPAGACTHARSVPCDRPSSPPCPPFGSGSARPLWLGAPSRPQPQPALFGDPCGINPNRWQNPQIRMTDQGGGQLPLTFFGQQGAGAKHQIAAWPNHPQGAIQQSRLQCHQPGNFRSIL